MVPFRGLYYLFSMTRRKLTGPGSCSLQNKMQHSINIFLTMQIEIRYGDIVCKDRVYEWRGSALSTKAQSALDQLQQIMRAGFVFLSAIDNQEKR